MAETFIPLDQFLSMEPPAPPPPSSALGEIGKGFVRGGGEALAGIGSLAKLAGIQGGAALQQQGQQIATSPQNAPQPAQHGGFVNTLASGAEAIGGNVVPVAADIGSALAGPAAPFVAAGLNAAYYGGTTYQDKLDQAKAAGLSDDQAHAMALKDAAIAGIAGAALPAAVGSVVRGTGGALVSKILPTPTLDQTLGKYAGGQWVANAGKAIAENAVTAPLAIGALSGGMAAVDKSYGLNVDPWQEALQGAQAGLGVAALAAPFSAYGARAAALQRKAASDTLSTAVPDTVTDPLQMAQAQNARQTALSQIMPDLQAVDPRGAQAFQAAALDAIQKNQPVDMSTAFPEYWANTQAQAQAASQAHLAETMRSTQLGESVAGPDGAQYVRTGTNMDGSPIFAPQGSGEAAAAMARSATHDLEGRPNFELTPSPATEPAAPEIPQEPFELQMQDARQQELDLQPQQELPQPSRNPEQNELALGGALPAPGRPFMLPSGEVITPEEYRARAQNEALAGRLTTAEAQSAGGRYRAQMERTARNEAAARAADVGRPEFSLEPSTGTEGIEPEAPVETPQPSRNPEQNELALGGALPAPTGANAAFRTRQQNEGLAARLESQSPAGKYRTQEEAKAARAVAAMNARPEIERARGVNEVHKALFGDADKTGASSKVAKQIEALPTTERLAAARKIREENGASTAKHWAAFDTKYPVEEIRNEPAAEVIPGTERGGAGAKAAAENARRDEQHAEGVHAAEPERPNARARAAAKAKAAKPTDVMGRLEARMEAHPDDVMAAYHYRRINQAISSGIPEKEVKQSNMWHEARAYLDGVLPSIRRDGVGDADAAKTQELLKGVTTLKEALQKVRGQLPPGLRVLADRLLRSSEVGSAKFGMSEQEANDQYGDAVPASYNPATHTATLHAGGGVRSLLHEAIHAYTAKAVRAPGAFRDEITKLFNDAKIQALEKGLSSADHYGLTNVDEFLAEAHSNARFASLLDSMQVRNQSLWSRFVEAVRKLLGLQPGQRSMLDSVLRTTDKGVRNYEAGLKTPAKEFASGVMNRAVRFNESPGEAFKAVHDTVKDLFGKEDAFLDKVAKVTPLNTLRSMALGWMDMHHIVTTYEKDLPQLRAIREAWGRIGATRSHLENQSSKITRMVEEWQKGARRKFGHVNTNAMDKLAHRMSLDGIDGRLDMSLDSFEAQPFLKELSRMHKEADIEQAVQSLKFSWEAEKARFEALKGAVEAAKTPQERETAQADLAQYNAERAHIEAEWKRMGTMRTLVNSGPLDSRYEMSGQDAIHQMAFHNYQRGRAKNDEAIKTWYEAFHSPDMGPTATTTAEMHRWMRSKDAPIGAQDGARRIDEAWLAMRSAPYFSQKRYGDYYTKYIGDDGKTYWEGYESEVEWKRAVANLRAAGRLDKEGFEGGRIPDLLQNQDANFKFARDFITRAQDIAATKYGAGTEEANAYLEHQKAVLEQTILSMLPQSSTRHSMSKRAGHEGAYGDVVRNFAQYAEAINRSIAILKHSPAVEQAIHEASSYVNEFRKTTAERLADPERHAYLSTILREVRQRQTNFVHPVYTPILDSFNRAASGFYLTMSPKYVIQNSLQPWHLTLPMLGGKYGFVKSAQLLGRHTATALKLIQLQAKQDFFNPIFEFSDAQLRSVGLDDAQMKLIRDMADGGKLDMSSVYALGAVARGGSARMEDVLRMAGLMAHYTEVVNRVSSALAAFDLERAKSQDIARATEAAHRTVFDTQIDYSEHNAPRQVTKHGFAGKLTPLALAFQKYNIGVMELLYRTAKSALKPAVTDAEKAERAVAMKQMLGVMGTTTLIAGALGVPAMNFMSGVYDRLRGEDAQGNPSDVKADFTNWVESWAGHRFGDALVHGMPRLAGGDLSQSVGLADLVPFTDLMMKRQDWKDKASDFATSALGPAYGVVTSFAKAADQIASGNVAAGVATGMPHAFTGAVKAMIDAGNGEFTDSHGNKLPIKATSWDNVVQAMGITPTAKAEHQEIQGEVSQRNYVMTRNQQRVRSSAVQMVLNGNEQGATDIVSAWNRAHPQWAISNLAQAIHEEQLRYGGAQTSGTGVLMSPKTAQRYTDLARPSQQ